MVKHIKTTDSSKSCSTKGKDLRTHYKNTYQVGKAIKGMLLKKAEQYLKEVLDIYSQRCDLSYNLLNAIEGVRVNKPDGAFYLWVKTLEPDDSAFVAKAKKYNLLLVPGSAFMCPGYVRIAYCVDTDMIKRSFDSFEKLAAEYSN